MRILVRGEVPNEDESFVKDLVGFVNSVDWWRHKALTLKVVQVATEIRSAGMRSGFKRSCHVEVILEVAEPRPFTTWMVTSDKLCDFRIFRWLPAAGPYIEELDETTTQRQETWRDRPPLL